MQQQFRALGRAIWVQPLFLNMNCQTVFRSDGDRIEGRLTRCPFHRFFHIEVPQSPVETGSPLRFSTLGGNALSRLNPQNSTERAVEFHKF